MSTMDLRTAKDRVEEVAQFHGDSCMRTVGMINAIKLVRRIWSEGFVAGKKDERDNGTHTEPCDQDQWDRGYQQGQEDAKFSLDRNFEDRARAYMETQIEQYLRMRRMMCELGADRAE